MCCLTPHFQVILIEISFRQPHQCEYSTHWTGNLLWITGCIFTPPAATLSVTPDRSQFFRYETLSLTCAAPANSSGWSVRRNTSFQTSKVCGIGWGVMAKTSCNIENAYQSDTGEYWCESPQGGCSNKVNITVTGNTKLYGGEPCGKFEFGLLSQDFQKQKSEMDSFQMYIVLSKSFYMWF